MTSHAMTSLAMSSLAMSSMTGWAALAAGSLLAAVWQGLVLTALVAQVLRAIPGIPAAVRSGLWSAVFLCVVALHFVPASPAPAAHHASPAWSLAVAALWLALSLYRAGQLAAGAWELRSLGRRALPVGLSVPAGSLRPHALLCTSTEVDRPSAMGFFRPRILIPAGLYARLSPDELQQIVLHEASHLRRGDDWTNLLQKCALVLFPLNPVLLWVERRLCRERELACDDRVLAATRAPKAYALCLTSLAEHAARHGVLSLALGAWQRRSELAARVERILQPPRTRLRPAHTAGLSAAVLLTLAGGAHLLAGSPQLLSFAAEMPPFPGTPALTAESGGLHAVGPWSATNVLTSANGGGKALLAKAVVPAPRASALAARPAAARQAAGSLTRSVTLIHARHHARPAPTLRQTATEHLLTGEPAYSSQPRLTVTIFECMPTVACTAAACPGSAVFVPLAAYAVATPNGWIFIQL
jgi:Zn-dependent protease with chaperone function